MTTPAPRTPIRLARGTKANLDAGLAAGDIKEGEIVYAKDQDNIYVVEAGVFTLVGGAISSVNGQQGAVVLDLGDINDVDLTTTPPVLGETLLFNGSSWVPGAGGGGGTGTGSIRGDGGDFTAGTVGFDFAAAVYGGGDFTTTSVDLPTELSGAMDGGSF